MFASAAREVVFANAEAVRRINEDFVPVALKAGLVNNPPAGVEGDLYREILRTRPAPQGICALNSSGKVLAWALSFDSEKTIPDFLEFAAGRYRQFPDATKPVDALRFMKYPSRVLAQVEDTGRSITIPSRHSEDERCPAKPEPPAGTLVGRVIGRALDENGRPVADTLRQEHYMEARFEIPVGIHESLAEAAASADGSRFRIPSALGRSLVAQAFLGQLDVNPLGGVPGSQSDSRWWSFHGERVDIDEEGATRIRVTGRSHTEGGQKKSASPSRSDGRFWEHAVSLDWQGYVDLRGERIIRLEMVASGRERLRWGNPRFRLRSEPDAAHLMAGHPIDLDCGVTYGLHAVPSRSE